MNTIDLKTDIFELVNSIEDKTLLNALKILLQKKVKLPENEEDLPEYLNKKLNESIIQSKKGELFEHDFVINEIKMKYLSK